MKRAFYDELEAIRELWPKRYRSEVTPEYQEKLQALYDTLWNDGSWKCDSGSAAMVTRELACLRIHQKEWTESVVILNRWLEEPGFQESDKDAALNFVDYRADCHSELRDLDLLINDLTLLKQQDSLMAARVILWTIECALAQDWIGDPLPAALRELASWSSKRITRRMKLARMAASAETAQEMKSIVEAARKFEELAEDRKRRSAWPKLIAKEGDAFGATKDEILDLYDQVKTPLDLNWQHREEVESRFFPHADNLFNKVFRDGVWIRCSRESALVLDLFARKLHLQGKFDQEIQILESWLSRSDLSIHDEWHPAKFKKVIASAKFELEGLAGATPYLIQLAGEGTLVSRRFAFKGVMDLVQKMGADYSTKEFVEQVRLVVKAAKPESCLAERITEGMPLKEFGEVLYLALAARSVKATGG